MSTPLTEHQRRQLTERLERRARAYRERIQPAEPAGSRLACVAFRKGIERYAVPVSQVLEIQALEHFSPVPKAPAYVTGVVQWRGALLALVDLGRLFRITDTGLADVHVFLVVEAAGRRVAVAATEVEDILEIAADQLQPVPEMPVSIPPEWLSGVYDINRLVLRMDAVLQNAT